MPRFVIAEQIVVTSVLSRSNRSASIICSATNRNVGAGGTPKYASIAIVSEIRRPSSLPYRCTFAMKISRSADDQIAELSYSVPGAAERMKSLIVFVESTRRRQSAPALYPHCCEGSSPAQRRSEEHTSELQSRRDLVC